MGGQRLTWSVEPSTVRKRFEALLQRMVDEAEAYAAFAQASGNELLMFDAEGLLEWVNGQAALSMRQSVQDALESAPFAEEALLKLLRAVESPLDRIKRRNATDEAQRWSDLVDWLYQMPGSLRNLLELEGLQSPAGDTSRPVKLSFQQNLGESQGKDVTVSVSGVMMDLEGEGLVA
ncbi:MAG: hypothetical protein DIU82_11725 [Bacillota bacterium]|nr:MAG: hypothetical protein DIU82_11725 [Bacillota bacterium]